MAPRTQQFSFFLKVVLPAKVNKIPGLCYFNTWKKCHHWLIFYSLVSEVFGHELSKKEWVFWINSVMLTGQEFWSWGSLTLNSGSALPYWLKQETFKLSLHLFICKKWGMRLRVSSSCWLLFFFLTVLPYCPYSLKDPHGNWFSFWWGGHFIHIKWCLLLSENEN